MATRPRLPRRYICIKHCAAATHRSCTKIFSLLHSAGATLKLKRYKFYTDYTDYFGHVICPRRLELASHTTDAIHRLHPPSNRTELPSFLGLCDVFRQLVPKFAQIAAPLDQRLMKNQLPSFPSPNSDEHYATETLKNALISLPILALPYSGRYIMLDTDTFNVSTCCSLLQKQPHNTNKPIW